MGACMGTYGRNVPLEACKVPMGPFVASLGPTGRRVVPTGHTGRMAVGMVGGTRMVVGEGKGHMVHMVHMGPEEACRACTS